MIPKHILTIKSNLRLLIFIISTSEKYSSYFFLSVVHYMMLQVFGSNNCPTDLIPYKFLLPRRNLLYKRQRKWLQWQFKIFFSKGMLEAFEDVFSIRATISCPGSRTNCSRAVKAHPFSFWLLHISAHLFFFSLSFLKFIAAN